MTNKIGPVDPNMIAKVGNKIDESRPAERTSAKSPAAESAAARPEAAAAADTVSLTSGAQLLERLEKSLEALPAVDSQRVDEIRTAIENGDYEIDPQAIADAMLRMERSFGE
ncbi:MAG: flagellar biosynthesis anti-sigma factor FlgM [Woeseiaceae bacterium]|nr:flagellar biosynthesis anti-sigma factor FlgM [Woeseiaceae bacterium]